MPSAGTPPPDRDAGARAWMGLALLVVGAITALRIALLALSRADLSVDEAQYWLWGQDLAWGYYSKPPLIAWVIRLSTGLAGSDAPFWVRLPAPLFHAATAMILGAIAARLFSPRAAVLAAAVYVTLPMVAVGSLLISTDTIMFPFLAGALALWLGLIAPGGGGRPDLAALAGALVGLAFLAKYAALYWLAFGALAALHPRARPDARDALALLAGLALVAAPNLAWNTANGLVTLSHTVDNTGWRGGLHLDPAGLARFLAEQALVFGPVALAALIVAAAGLIRRGPGPVEALLLLLCLPVVGLVALQALVSGANANWAAAAYLAGTLLIVPLLLRSWPWRWGTLAMNGALALALPLAATQAESLRWGDRLLLARYVGLDELSRAALDLARAQGAAGIVAAERGVLADLLYTGRDAGVPIWAAPHQGPPRNHYEQRHALPREAPGPLILLQREAAALPCAPLAVTPLDSGPGAYRGRPFAAALVPRDCWAPR